MEDKDLNPWRQKNWQTIYRVPTWTEKPGKFRKMGRHFPVREKSGNFNRLEKSGKSQGKSHKIWKTGIN